MNYLRTHYIISFMCICLFVLSVQNIVASVVDKTPLRFIPTESNVLKCITDEHPDTVGCLLLKAQLVSQTHTSDEVCWFIGMYNGLMLDLTDEHLAFLLHDIDKVIKSYPNYFTHTKDSCVKSANNVYNVYAKFNNDLVPDLSGDLFEPILSRWSTHACNTGKSKFDLDKHWDVD